MISKNHIFEGLQGLFLKDKKLKVPWKPPATCREVESEIEIYVRQSLFSLHIVEKLSKMIERTDPSKSLNVLLSQFLHWGYLSLEQAMTASAPNHDLIHNLNSLANLSPVDLSQNLWLQEADEGTLIARYPFDCLAAHRDFYMPLIFILIQPTIPVSFSLTNFVKHLAQGHLELIPSSPEAVAFKTALSKWDGQEKIENPKKVKGLFLELEEAEMLFRSSREDLQIYLELGLFSPSQERALKNVVKHLGVLEMTFEIVRRFPHQEYGVVYGVMILLAGQYGLENFGRFIKSLEGVDLTGHDLNIYYQRHPQISREELMQIQSFNVHKGSEYPYRYFVEFDDKGLEKPWMILISELYAYSMGQEGFTPKGLEKKTFEEVFDQLKVSYQELAKLFRSLVDKCVLEKD